jgi:hypothetical protein
MGEAPPGTVRATPAAERALTVHPPDCAPPLTVRPLTVHPLTVHPLTVHMDKWRGVGYIAVPGLQTVNFRAL